MSLISRRIRFASTQSSKALGTFLIATFCPVSVSSALTTRPYLRQRQRANQFQHADCAPDSRPRANWFDDFVFGMAFKHLSTDCLHRGVGCSHFEDLHEALLRRSRYLGSAVLYCMRMHGSEATTTTKLNRIQEMGRHAEIQSAGL